MRYTLNISFNDFFTRNMVEKVKTLKEVAGYTSIIDDTVKEACVIDNINGKVVMWLKKKEERTTHRMPLKPSTNHSK